MLLTECLLAQSEILESDQSKLHPGILCRVKYPVCNVNELNANRRVYGWDVWDHVRENKDLQEKIKNRSLFGHAEHPASSQSNLEVVSHVLVETVEDRDNNVVYQVFDVFDTPTGRIVDCILKSCKVGVSTRANGELVEERDEKTGKKFNRVVGDKYQYITTDFTADPSTYGSIPVEVKRNVAEKVKAEMISEKIKDEEKQFATAVLDSMRCDGDECHNEPADKMNEGEIQIVADPDNNSVTVMKAKDVGVIASGQPGQNVVTVSVHSNPEQQEPEPTEPISQVKPEGEESEVEEEPESLEAELKPDEEEMEESRIWENTDEALEDALYHLMKGKPDQAVESYLIQAYGMPETEAKDVIMKAHDQMKDHYDADKPRISQKSRMMHDVGESKEADIGESAKLIADMRILEATTRAERDRLAEELDTQGNLRLEHRMVLNRLKAAREFESKEEMGLRSMVESKAQEVKRLTETIELAHKDIKEGEEFYKSEIQKLTESHKAEIAALNEDHEKAIGELNEANKLAVQSAVKEQVNKYAESQLSLFGSVHENLRALLAECKSIDEANEVLDDYRKSRRRSALHSPIQETKVIEETRKESRSRKLVRGVCESLNGK
jgi:hypothetical protein